MHSANDGERPQALYALVLYLPDPLGAFLDDLRLEMAPGCNPHAHVSVLPPRALEEAPETAIAQSQRTVARFDAFDIVLGGIEKFDATDVIYIAIEKGAQQLHQMHGALNQDALAFPEVFAYYPHVTLAQEIAPEKVEPLVDLAVRRWRDFRGPRSFRAERTVFVRNTGGNIWIDLADAPLRAAPVSRVDTRD